MTERPEEKIEAMEKKMQTFAAILLYSIMPPP